MFTEKQKAFSLVELLVVISIIGLLMAILMPALAAAKSQAKSIVCKSNLRQLVLANIGYATEDDGYYVAAASDLWDGAGGYHRWHGLRDDRDKPFDPLRGPLVAYLSSGKVKQCPERVRFVKGKTWSESFEKGCGGYGYNMTYLGCRLWQSGIATLEQWKKAHAETTRISEVAKPSETLMFADCALSIKAGYYIEYSFAEPPFVLENGKPKIGSYMSPSIHFRHRALANIGWTDGHVGSRKMADFDLENTYGVNSANMKLGWFEPIDNSLFDLK